MWRGPNPTYVLTYIRIHLHTYPFTYVSILPLPSAQLWLQPASSRPLMQRLVCSLEFSELVIHLWVLTFWVAVRDSLSGLFILAFWTLDLPGSTNSENSQLQPKRCILIVTNWISHRQGDGYIRQQHACMCGSDHILPPVSFTAVYSCGAWSTLNLAHLCNLDDPATFFICTDLDAADLNSIFEKIRWNLGSNVPLHNCYSYSCAEIHLA